MANQILNVAYGMNSGVIPKMTSKALIAAFFMANTNLPSIKPENQSAIIRNMGRIADEMSDRVYAAKGQSRIRLDVHLIVMQVIIKKLYTPMVWSEDGKKLLLQTQYPEGKICPQP